MHGYVTALKVLCPNPTFDVVICCQLHASCLSGCSGHKITDDVEDFGPLVLSRAFGALGMALMALR